MGIRNVNKILVTGGAGFLGRNFINYLGQINYAGQVINLDALTYGDDAPTFASDLNYRFEKKDICDYAQIVDVFDRYRPNTVVHFAAETHVDHSIDNPRIFLNSNVVGTFNVLEAARSCWKSCADVHFHHVSTDEVYGALGDEGSFCEKSTYDPRSPYSAAKAASDHFVMAYHHTYGMPVTISNSSNNYGPYQYADKLIPLLIKNALEQKQLPIYGDGQNVRDWIHACDHSSAIWRILENGLAGESYNIGGENEVSNLNLAHQICQKLEVRLGKKVGSLDSLITFVADRPGHDYRYSVDCSKLKSELGWQRTMDFTCGLDQTIEWYLEQWK